MVASSAWCLGDWLVYGQQIYGGRYREAVEQTGLDYQTLRNYAWVARRFGLSRRRDSLSFGHHAEVASLPEPEQDFWLRKAAEFGWSTSQLRREVRGEASPGEPSTDAQVIKVRLTREQSELCGQAARRQGLPLPAWAAQILDDAPRRNP